MSATGGQEEWIVVREFSELFVGCSVRHACGFCRGKHIGTLLSGPETALVFDQARCLVQCECFETSIRCKGYGGPFAIARESVARGFVERLRPDEAPAATTTETTRPRTLERVR